MIMLLAQSMGVDITPMIRFMFVCFEAFSVGVVVLRIVDAVRRPRLADLAAERRERWEAAYAAPSGHATELDDD
ncbi:hypothetical protein CFP66_40820 [Pseudonocardia sp. MH-G8]|nr:hypothetical protein CFP66_40820 [Pseudonocardia sp. MH-G8]